MVLIAAAALPLQAQWLRYLTPGAPRTRTGAIDLTAPAPRTADGKPDLSGLWQTDDNRPCPADGCADFKVAQEFFNIGWSLKGGLPFLPWAAAITKERTAENRLHDPNSYCLPVGIVRMHTAPFLRKVVQTPGLLVILNERNVWYRQVFTDGRPLPVDPQPSWNGYSSGKWDGDTLVITSSGFRDGLWLDSNGSPLTPSARITERFRRVNYGTLEIGLTVSDANAYTSPWTVVIYQRIMPDTELIDAACYENERDVQHLVGK
jgi:hypothetical protein